MRRGATREEIIHTTKALITQNGIRAVRVDEIAAVMGISKRTLYEMFEDKVTLMAACLEEISAEQRGEISSHLQQDPNNALSKALWLFNKYIEVLYSVDRNFLIEMQRVLQIGSCQEDSRVFWERTANDLLSQCIREEYVLPGLQIDSLTQQIITAVYEARLSGAERQSQSVFCRTLLRGTATTKGQQWLDQTA